ncbi:mechanosensitive ion channel protein MscS [Candidatus Aerophobetes bacterium]|uniref:Mechanosensitive ion channel protein MscS n=1 Tax=Aerophobetes bacterium TaxID=2030807 RepID=A0A2A4X673_UNCAE|nr:MAG: mechanosensitive ion channel protein MscS [Candidatus Aerophobetes bacterium]
MQDIIPQKPPASSLDLLIMVGSILLIAFITHFIISQVYKHVLPRVKKTHLVWDEALLSSIIQPLKWVVWILALSFSVQNTVVYLQWSATGAFFSSIRHLCIAFFMLIFFLKFIGYMENAYTTGKKSEKGRYDKTTVRAVCQISRVAALLITSIIYLQTQSINLSAILAFGGAGGLIVGLAAQDLLANFFGGLMIYLDRPFSVGEWIRSSDREIEGTVEQIGWRLTKIRTFDKRLLYVPNGLFSKICVENPSRMTNRRIKTKVGIRYDDASKMYNVVTEVEAMLKEHDEIDNEKFMMVRFDEFANSSLNFIIYCFTRTTDWAKYMTVQQDVYLKTIEIIEKHGAEIAFPTRVLHFDGPQPIEGR